MIFRPTTVALLLLISAFLPVLGPSEVSAPTPTPAKPVLGLRLEYYQSAEKVLVMVFAKGLLADSVTVNFSEQTVNVTIEGPEETYVFQPRLFGKIVPEKCSFTVLSTNVEIRLAKVEHIYWTSLEFVKDSSIFQRAMTRTLRVYIIFPAASTVAALWVTWIITHTLLQNSIPSERNAAIIIGITPAVHAFDQICRVIFSTDLGAASLYLEATRESFSALATVLYFWILRSRITQNQIVASNVYALHFPFHIRQPITRRLSLWQIRSMCYQTVILTPLLYGSRIWFESGGNTNGYVPDLIQLTYFLTSSLALSMVRAVALSADRQIPRMAQRTHVFETLLSFVWFLGPGVDMLKRWEHLCVSLALTWFFWLEVQDFVRYRHNNPMLQAPPHRDDDHNPMLQDLHRDDDHTV